jgi:hypothetical protein
MSFGRHHDELLSRLEQGELALLSWGRVDGTLTEREVHDVAAAVAGDPDSARMLLDDLLAWHLLLDVGQRDPLYRTRFAESVRLMARNRQLVPRRSWRAAPELVNDFRVIAQPRRFPRRDVPMRAVLDALGAARPLAPAEDLALRAMLTSDGGELRLARFQYEAAEHIRTGLLGAAPTATMICAGTGSGKTKAFYLPVLSALAVDAATDPSRWARVIAIYPRNELLKDQLVESLSQVERIAAQGGPVLAIGAFFGPTARTSRLDREDGWYVVDGGHACHYIRCPNGCIADLVWRDDVRAAGREVLACPRCGWRSRDGQIALTRDTIRATPPHLLFTSTEMLNRSLADAAARQLFLGPSARQCPWALLLDEVHTYGGVHGGQVAMLLRRWRGALGRSSAMHVVGLSATLEGPEEFFAQLTGIRDVRVIRPADDDLTEQGAQYAVALRGNPVSGTALLSTTIQTAFLLGRLVEARDARERSETSGSRVFAFTDNLDVTNRLYWDLRDAEQGGGGRDPLAVLRREDAPEPRERDAAGQVWRLPPLLGRPLDAAHRLRVTRTSGQDAGVDMAADVIVATSALEVGFDDPEVGAVLQHKAPRDDAAFAQRRGRAGRRTEMRPWTVVVLSDYGRDRLRYQAYETLFAPTLAPRTLPIDNLHVLKMQAAYALLDWLADRIPYLNARADLSGPSDDRAGSRHRRQGAAAAALRQVLEDPQTERNLERHVRRGLELTEAQARAVMWDPPRALMTSTVPTLLRRLETNWSTVSGRLDLTIRGVPLPEHAPGALFSDLNLPEVEIVAPRPFDLPPRIESMSVPQALGEFVPGRSSRRFAVESGRSWLWVPRPSPEEDGVLRSDVSQWITRAEPAGEVVVGDEARPVLRPWRLELELVPPSDDTANARPAWSSALRPTGPGWDVNVPHASALHRLVPRLRFYTHALGNELHVVRAVTRVMAETSDGVEESVELVTTASGAPRPVAVGFAADVDAVCAAVNKGALPSLQALPPDARRAVRTSWFEAAVVEDVILRARASRFSLGWMATLFLAALAGVAIGEQTPDLATTLRRVRELGTARCLARALEGVFAVTLGDDDSRGVERLKALIEDGDVIARLESMADQLVRTDTGEFDLHARKTALTTIAGAIREAFQRLAPTFDAEGLIVDFGESEAAGDELELWLSEPDVGSAGTVDEIRRRIAEEPTRFARLVANAVGPTDLEIVDADVRLAVIEAAHPSPLANAFRQTRAAVGARAGTDAQRALRSALRETGITAEHGVMATLNLRVLRPGSSPATDAALVEALVMWDDAERSLELELDGRAVAYAMSRRSSLTLEQVYSLLWARGRGARGAGLNAYSRYSDPVGADRLVLSSAFEDRVPPIPFSSTVLSEVETALRTTGVARVVAPTASANGLQHFIADILTRSLDVGSVSGYARVVSASRHADALTVTLELPEAAG